ncbi:uncharacterized protein VTP21DRAFT_1641 [Calcarisporiella thermophila]|uniref:uncharacterized protein n=1 Tax=Calcarisporiella thermophila TaxID=911321 RepID=UPI003743D518
MVTKYGYLTDLGALVTPVPFRVLFSPTVTTFAIVASSRSKALDFFRQNQHVPVNFNYPTLANENKVHSVTVEMGPLNTRRQSLDPLNDTLWRLHLTPFSRTLVQLRVHDPCRDKTQGRWPRILLKLSEINNRELRLGDVADALSGAMLSVFLTRWSGSILPERRNRNSWPKARRWSYIRLLEEGEAEENAAELERERARRNTIDCERSGWSFEMDSLSSERIFEIEG